jgi:amino acid transporter
LLPAPLARLSRHHTPLGGNILILAVSVLLILLAVLTKGDPSAVFGTMSTVGSLVIEVIYIALAIVAIRFVRESSAQWWHWIALFVAIVTPILGIYGSVIPFPPFPASLGVYGALAAVVLAAVWTGVIAFFFPKRLTAIVDSTTTTDEPPSAQEVVQAD